MTVSREGKYTFCVLGSSSRESDRATSAGTAVCVHFLSPVFVVLTKTKFPTSRGPNSCTYIAIVCPVPASGLSPYPRTPLPALIPHNAPAPCPSSALCRLNTTNSKHASSVHGYCSPAGESFGRCWPLDSQRARAGKSTAYESACVSVIAPDLSFCVIVLPLC